MDQPQRRTLGRVLVTLAAMAALASGCGTNDEGRDAESQPQAVELGTSPASPDPGSPGEPRCEPIDTAAPDGASAANVTVGSVTRDPPGPNSPTMLNKEVVSLTSTAKSTIDLTGWNLADGDGVSYTFPPGSVICQSVVISLHSGRGANTDTDFYADWGWRWDDQGDTVRIHDAEGRLVATCGYTSSSPALRC
jgi:YD repeat-containing protein